jgi:hypothetical protein
MMVSCRASADEQNRALPGDSLIPEPMAAWTHAITIASPSAKVWQWIAQMGADRAGWYAYDFIDNGGCPSARKILPQYQEVVVGQIFPALPGATDAFLVAEVNPARSIVLTVPEKGVTPIVTWSFLLVPIEISNTRLLVRARVTASWRDLARRSSSGDRILLINRIYRLLALFPVSLMSFIGGIGHGIMQRRMLRGIKRRVETWA